MIAILEDDQEFAESLELEFSARGMETYSASQWKALDKSLLQETDYALIDLRLQEDSGLECIRRIKQINPSIVIIVMTGYGTISTATQAIKLGAKEYFTKPISIDQVMDSFYDCPPEEQEANTSPTKRQSLSTYERDYVEYVLAQCKGNITHAANWLGIRRQSLQRKLKKYPPAEN